MASGAGVAERQRVTSIHGGSVLGAPRVHPDRAASGAWLTNLPAAPTPLIGREQELHTARARLLLEQVRLLTLTGPGGSGKTRLALAVADGLHGAFADGVWLVDLTPLREPSLVLPAIARVLGIQQAGRRPIIETLCERLRERQLLLVLDNCEHVLGAAPQIAELPGCLPSGEGAGRQPRAVATALGARLPVPPLTVPDVQSPLDVATLRAIPSVELFVQRAQAVAPSFALTRRECRGGGTALCPAGRVAAGPGAGRRSDQAPVGGDHAAPAGARIFDPDLGSSRPSGPASDAVRGDQLELRPARRG